MLNLIFKNKPAEAPQALNRMVIFFTVITIVILSFFLMSSVFAQNIGVNTDGTAPTELLHVKSTAASSGNILIEHTLATQETGLRWLKPTAGANWKLYVPVSSSDLRLYNAADLVTFKASGKIGIGTTGPSSVLDIIGDGSTDANAHIRFTEQANGFSTTLGIVADDADFQIKDIDNSRVNLFISKSVGNIGIRTTAPNSMLDLASLATATSTGTQSNSGTISLTNSNWTGAAETKQRFELTNRASVTSNNWPRFSISQNGSELFSINYGGKSYGFGTIEQWDGAGGASTILNVFARSTTGSMANLNLVGGVVHADGNQVGGINFSEQSNGGTPSSSDKNIAQIIAVVNGASATTGGNLSFRTRIDGITTLPSEKMVVMGTGNVGIGINPPNTQLHVATKGAFATLRLQSDGHDNAYAGAQIFLSNSTTLGDLSSGTNAQGIITYLNNGFASSYMSIGTEFYSDFFKLTRANAWASRDVKLSLGTTIYLEDIIGGAVTNRVGIGTSGPSALLDVNGSTRLRALTAGYVKSDASGNITSGAIASGDIPAGSGNYIQNQTAADQSAGFRISASQSGATALATVTNTFNATTNDSYGLKVTGGNSIFAGSGTPTTYGVYIQGGNSTNSPARTYGLYVLPGTGTGNLYAAYFGGNVGVGTNSPNNKFDIAYATRTGTHSTGRALYVTGTFTPNSNGVEFRHDNGTQGIGFGYNTIYATGSNATQDLGFQALGATGNLLFTTNAAERMRITGGGNVGIGTTTPLAKVEIRRSAAGQSLKIANENDRAHTWFGYTDGNNYITGDAQTGTGNLIIRSDNGSAYTEHMRVLASNGNVGIGSTAPTQKLEVVGRIKSNGINETSDIRFKKNVVPLSSALEKTLSLTGVNFDWKIEEFPDKNFDGKLQMGLIAQEVEKIIPEVVITDGEGYKSVEYSKIVGLLIEAIKEQQKTIYDMQKEISLLKTDNEQLKAATGLSGSGQLLKYK